VETKDSSVDAGIQLKGVDFGKERLQEVAAETFFLRFVENKTIGKVV